MKRIFKYPTGATIPKGAIYLSTVTQVSQEVQRSDMLNPTWIPCWLVWHYFLVEDNSKK